MFINVPIGIAIILLAPHFVPEPPRVVVPNAATPTSNPSWLTVTITPVASAASATGIRISTAVISGLNALAMAAPSTASTR